MNFSEKLTKLRKEHSLSQEKLAEELDVSRQSVSKWESGQTYPEMDKLLAMCKIFNVTLDDLTNDQIKYDEVKTKNKNYFDSLVGDVTYIIDKTFYMFKNTSSKQRGKIIGELILLFLVLWLFKIPFNRIIYLGENVINSLPYAANFLSNLWSFFINIVYLGLFVFAFIYIYKTNYLDKFVKEEKEIINEGKIIKGKKENELNPVNNKEGSKNVGGTLFNTIKTIISICFKVFLAFVSVPFIFSFIALFAAFFILLSFIIKGVTYFGFLICVIAGIMLNGFLLELIISFIANHKPNYSRLLITLLAGLGLLGIGVGVSILDISKTEYIDEAPIAKYELVTKEFNYKISDNLLINDYIFRNVDYVIDESLEDNVKITIKYNDKLSDIILTEEQQYDYTAINFEINDSFSKDIVNLIVDNLKNKKIYNYGKLYYYEITITASEEAINRLNKNLNDYHGLMIDKEIEVANEHINNLNSKIDYLEEQNEILTEENDSLKETINEYKENLKNMLE